MAQVLRNPATKKEDNPAYSRLMCAGKIFFFVFLTFTIAFMAIYSIFDKQSAVKKDEIRFVEKWTVIDSSGKTFETGRSFTDNKVYDGDFAIISHLPDGILDNEVLCFCANIEVTVYIGGKLRQDITVNNQSNLPGGHVKSFYVAIPLTASDSGAEIKMVRSTPSNQPRVVPETFVSTINGVYVYLFDRYGLSFCFSLILLVLSILVIIVSLGMMIWYHQKIEMLFGALGVFIVAGWLVTNSYLYPFIFGHYHVDGVANYMFCLMIPFGFILYLDSLQQGMYRKFMSVIMICTAVNTALWTVLDFAGILAYVDALLYIDIVLGILVVLGFIMFTIDIRRGNVKKYKFTAIGFVGFLFFCVVELIVLMFMSLYNDDIPMLFGLMFLLTFVVIQQVDDLRRINAEKQRAIDLSDAKTRFLASMSHEIRTPINSILGMNEIIIKENKDAVIDHYAKTVRNSGKLLLTLVNDVLDFSKIEADKVEIAEEEYSLSRLFSEILPMLAERAGNKLLDFRTSLVSEIPDGQIGDEYRIKQILTNLISNAVKYTDSGSVEVKLGGEYRDDDIYNLKISVKDTGRGIKKEDIPALFDAFSRADIRNNNNIEGTGLGLAIVKRILDAMGGKISVESEYGSGSEFIVEIPVKVFDKTPVKEDFSYDEKANEEEVYRCEYTSDARVLAVDDNRSNLTIVRLFLKETGIEPDVCSGGKEAIELCKKNKYDLILLDHMMPAPDGMETLKAIKNDNDSLNKDTVVIVLTANAIAGSREMYLEAGFADYLVKPIDSKKLIRSIKKYLPQDKVHEINDDDYIEIFEPGADDEDISQRSLKERLLLAIPGIDYDSAIHRCGDDESILEEILADIANESGPKIERMRETVKEKKYSSYAVDAHSLKSTMATIGVMELSERARKHEFAAKEENTSFIDGDYESLLNEYADICTRIRAVVG